MPQDVSHYNQAFYTRNIPELRDWKAGRLRGEDMCGAILYALGFPSFDETVPVVKQAQGKPFQEQARILWGVRRRRPKFVLDLGCGRGEVCSFFANQGVKVVGVDPSPGSQELAMPTVQKWVGGGWSRRCQVWHEGTLKAASQLTERMKRLPDTVLLVETLEHIPKDEFDSCYTTYLVPWLRETKGLFIVTNWMKYHPIRMNPKKPWCHLREVDDQVYDWLASFASAVVFRRRSHLVLQF